MRARTPPHPRQLRLFHEIVEQRLVSDRPFDDGPAGWGSMIAPPTGRGWRIVDYSRDRKTQWQRRRPVIIPPRRASRGGGGWRQ